jgi:mycothiol S-conjugate amidase
MCYIRWSIARVRAMHEKFLELGLESPYQDERFKRMLESAESDQSQVPEERPRVTVDITGYTSVMREALLAHATQVDPNSRHWFGLPPEVADTVYPVEEYEVARDVTATGPSADDLFHGVETVTAGVSSDA